MANAPKPVSRPGAQARSPGAPPRRPGVQLPGRPGAPSAFQSGGTLANARRAPGRGTQENYARSQAIKLGILVVVALALVVGGIFAVKAMRGPARPVVGSDAEAKKIMMLSSYEEINSWLTQGLDRSLVGHTPAQSKRLADEIYALGPAKVLAGGGRASMHVVIELPADPAARARLVEWRNKWAEKYGGTPPIEKDVGQQYLIAEMPLNR